MAAQPTTAVANRARLEQLAQTDVTEPIPPEALLQALASPPFIMSKSLINMRDAGASPGSALPRNRIYRCGTLELVNADPAAQQWLSTHVRRIFDLRKPVERDSSPEPSIPGVESVWHLSEEGEYPVPQLEDFVTEEQASLGWRKQLLRVAYAYRPMIRAILEHVRDRPEEPFLFHCTAGRDRTGVVAGLLQYLGGTAPDDVVLDYMLSRVGIEPAREKLMAFALKLTGTDDPSTPGYVNLVSLRPAYWTAFLEGIQEDFGGWDGYVTKGLGFSAKDLETMKANLRAS